MSSNTVFISLIVVIIILIVVLFKTTQTELTTKGYITNIYLYILLGLLICSLVVVAIDQYKLINWENYGGATYIIISIVTFIILVAMMFVSKQHVVLKHLLWVLFIIGIGVMIFPAYEFSMYRGTLWKSMLTVIILVLILSFISYVLPPTYFNSWGLYLTIALFAIIIFQLLDIFFSDPSILYSHSKIYAVILIIIFSGFVLYDTGKIAQNASEAIDLCKGQTNQFKCVDYPGDSVGIFLDIINLFVNTQNLS